MLRSLRPDRACRALTAVVAVALAACAPSAPSPTSTSSTTATSATTTTTTTTTPPREPPDAYLWQRRGNADAVFAFAAWSTGALHLLMAERRADSRPYVRGHDDVRDAAKRSGVPVVAVVRVDDSAAASDLALGAVDDLVGAGVNVVGVEIDFDCGTARLARYAAVLRATRARLSVLHPHVRLGITALPAWLHNRAVAEVFAAVDDVTLQVHSIRAPALFDVDDARAAVRAATALVPTVRVALPTYAVDLKAGPALAAVPADVAALAATTARRSYFRLPMAGDETAWTFATLKAVDAAPVLAAVLAPAVAAFVDADPDAGAERVAVVVENRGAVDVVLGCVTVAGDAAHDGIAPFVVDDHGRLCPARARFLAPGARVVAGWARPVSTSVSTSTPSSAASVSSSSSVGARGVRVSL